MQTFEQHKVVDQGDLDDLEHVNNVRYVQWVQDIAEEHWENKTNEAILKRFFWVLVEHHIKYKSPAILGDVLKIKTYVEKSGGLKSERIVEITNENTHDVIVQSKTTWVFMSRQSNKPTRIPEDIRTLFD